MYPIIDSIKTGERIKELMINNNLCPKDIQAYLSLTCIQTVYRWLSGISVPSIDNLYALSELFHTPIDDIIQGNRQSVYMTVPFVKEISYSYYLYH